MNATAVDGTGKTGKTEKGDVNPGNPEDSAEAVLRFRDFNVRYGTAPASVRGVDLTVRSGEIVGLIGESGSGKTSVAMACLGLLPKQAQVTAELFEVCGTDLSAADDKALTRLRGSEVAMVFQDAMGALDPSMRVGRQIGEVLTRHRGLKGDTQRQAVVELLRRVRVPEPERRARQYPHQLSGGLRQRVAMALALAGEPRLLLADEPTTALDVTVQAEILRLLRTIRDEFGVAILLISHDIGVIAQTADRVAVMRDGEIVETGAVEEVLLSPASDYTKMLLGSVPTVGKRVRPESTNGESDAYGESGAYGIAGSEGSALFTADGLSRSFRSDGHAVHALRDVSLSVGRGEVLGVVGESGSGKSTLAKMLVRLDRPTSGRLEKDGADYSRLRGKRLKAFRRAVQMVFQHPAGSLNPKLRVATSVREPLATSGVTGGEARLRIDEVLAEVGLPPEAAGRLPHEFSGGQKQRIAIARAIAARPEVVVLDEPTSALDVSVQAQVLDLLLTIQQAEELTYVFISHDLAVVQAVSDRVVVMYAGRVVEVAEAEALFASPAHWYTRALLDAVPSPDPRDRPEPGAMSPSDEARPEKRKQAEAQGCAFASRCSHAASRCWAEVPELSMVRAGHAAACHFPADTDTDTDTDTDAETADADIANEEVRE